jgi:hypothetical protein
MFQHTTERRLRLVLITPVSLRNAASVELTQLSVLATFDTVQLVAGYAGWWYNGTTVEWRHRPDPGEISMAHASRLTDTNETDEACMIFLTQAVDSTGSTMPMPGFLITLSNRMQPSLGTYVGLNSPYLVEPSGFR